MRLRTDLLGALYRALSGRSPTPKGLAALQCRALRRVVAHAYNNVPHYRRLFDANGVDPRAIRTLSDLRKIPITDRDDLREAPVGDVVARGVRADRLVCARTSGTSGAPFTVRCTWLEQCVLMLSWFRALGYFGRRSSDKIAAILYLQPGLVFSGGFQQWLRNKVGFYPSLTVNMCLQPAQILEAIREYRPDFLGSYPGVLFRVAELTTERGRPALGPRCIWVGGEVLTEVTRRQITEAFGAPVYNCYASEEFKLMAWECGQTGELHVCADNVILEVLKDGRPAAPGERGEVVGTNLLALSMPFIRYRIGDIVTQGSERCACGQPFPTIRDVQGRTLDYFPLPDGRLLHPYDISRVILETTDWIRYHEILQEREDRIVLRVVPYGNPSRETFLRLEKAVLPVLGPGVTFRVVRVAEIKPDPSGKFRYARSLVTPGGVGRRSVLTT